MAKARRPPFAAAERFLGFPRGGASVFPAAGDDDLPDLAEADVWYSEPGPAPNEAREDERTTTVGGRAPRRAVGGLSRAFGDGRQVAASAPVQVPAWPSHFADQEAFVEPPQQEEDEESKDAGGWVPPHVYLARRQARASVVEGVGRTLKGRDMSRVRDAVWSRTGFDG
ncbi:hypothetical protein PR202_ga29828 [Eleusine coracana subsp. coracana]|uniref:Senescence regulator n=1 Tax=Eleusine coracana subsp. coracana TaxID=191504 RepID=A0AAV5DME6_ELECO|nr:hypothetical protein QOZ80_7AG0569210 [Eleusine coracana subsp. coracana]GJN11626.1 hypothetical protein PR202_ga29828 [Eleusine coracana subsp. coracana]